MRYYTALMLLAASALAGACGGDPDTNAKNASNTGNSAASNTIAAQNSNMDGVRRPDAPTTNDAPTLGPVVVAFYEALKARSDSGVRAVLSQKQIQSIEADMKEENRTDIAGFLAEFESLPETRIEIRNENISGSKGVAEVRGGTYVNWTPLGFVLENGKWKLSGESPDLDRVGPAK